MLNFSDVWFHLSGVLCHLWDIRLADKGFPVGQYCGYPVGQNRISGHLSYCLSKNLHKFFRSFVQMLKMIMLNIDY